MDTHLTLVLMDIFVFVLGVTLHEFGHAFAADRLGDDTPRRQGRVELNPLDHLDPIGTIVFVASALFGNPFGWGKPVRVQPGNFKHPRRDSLIVSLAGPVMNLLLALICAGAIRATYDTLPATSVYFQLLCRGVEVNMILFLFNLIPLPPLDGSKILSAILPMNQALAYDKAMAQWGLILFVLLSATATPLIGPTIERVSNAMGNTSSAPTDFDSSDSSTAG